MCVRGRVCAVIRVRGCVPVLCVYVVSCAWVRMCFKNGDFILFLVRTEIGHIPLGILVKMLITLIQRLRQAGNLRNSAAGELKRLFSALMIWVRFFHYHF